MQLRLVCVYLRARSARSSRHPFPPPLCGCLYLVFNDAEFSRWALINYHVWNEVYEDEMMDVSPSVIVEYANESDPLQPQFNIVVEDQLSACSAQEYVERQQMPQSTVDIDFPLLKEEVAKRGTMDVATCAFGEEEGITNPFVE